MTRATLRAERREVYPGVTVDPKVCGGLPYITGRGIVCAVVRARFMSGEGADDIAADYRITQDEVDAALRWFLLSPGARKRRMEGK
jgi:uncharacterized protein (DUF433 family)